MVQSCRPVGEWFKLKTGSEYLTTLSSIQTFFSNLSFKILKQYSIFVERIFESLFIEITISSSKNIIVGSVYHPGTKVPGLTFTQQFTQFSEILSNVLAELSNNYENVFI